MADGDDGLKPAVIVRGLEARWAACGDGGGDGLATVADLGSLSCERRNNNDDAGDEAAEEATRSTEGARGGSERGGRSAGRDDDDADELLA